MSLSREVRFAILHQSWTFVFALQRLRAYRHVGAWAEDAVGLYQQKLYALSEVEDLLSERDRDDFRSEAGFIESGFEQDLRVALFIALYAHFEQAMSDVCDDLRKRKRYSLKPTDLRDRGVVGYRTYLVKVCGVNFPDEVGPWSTIRALGTIRNHLVHVGRDLRPEAADSKVRSAIEAVPEATVSDDEIELETEFIHSCVLKLEDLLTELANRLVEPGTMAKRNLSKEIYESGTLFSKVDEVWCELSPSDRTEALTGDTDNS